MPSSVRVHRKHVDKDIRVIWKKGISIKLTNPLKTRAIAKARVKTDKIEFRTLAVDLLRTDFIAYATYTAEDQGPKTGSQAQRENLVKNRTKLQTG